MKNLKIVAIGGGEIGRPGCKIETEEIDKETIRLTGKKSPKLLFLPTASGDSESYYDVVKKYFGKRLGCKTDVLYLLNEEYSKKEMREKVLGTDIIYVGGGNTLKMMRAWRKKGLDKLIMEAAKKGIVLSGVSAGAICWFKYGNSDSLKFKKSENPFIRVRGLGLVDLMICPHYDAEPGRKKSLREMVEKRGGVSVALENCSAIEIIGERYKILTSSKKAKAKKVCKKKGKIVEEKLDEEVFRPLEELFS